MSSLNEKLDYLNETKQLIRSSIIQRGLPVDDSVPFRDYADMILEIDSDFVDDRDVTNNFTYNTDGYYAQISGGYSTGVSVLCVGKLFNSDNVLENTFYVIYNVVSVDNGIMNCRVMDILDEYNDYSDTLTPEEYNECNDTLDEILDGVSPSTLSAINLFVQDYQPDVYNGIWVKTNNNYENFVAVQNALSENGIYNNLGNFPVRFTGGLMALIDSTIYLFYTSAFNPLQVYKYDILSNECTRLEDAPYSLNSSAIAPVGTDVYIIGGNATETSKSINKYNTLTGEFSSVLSISGNSIYDGSAVAVGTNIYYFMGAYIRKFNTLTNEFIDVGSSSFHKFNGSPAVAIGTDIYLFGSEESGYETVLSKFDTSTNQLTQLSNIPYNFSNCSVAVVGTDIYLFGGGSSNNNNCYKYDTLADEFIQLDNIPYKFSYGRVIAYNSTIYLFGGGTKLSNIYSFDLTLNEGIPNNSLVLEQSGNLYKTVLFDSNFVGGLEYKFTNVWLKNSDGNIDSDTKIFYGDGSKWIQFSGEVDD